MKRQLRINWEIEAKRSYFTIRSTFRLLKNGSLVLAYNHTDEYDLNEKGRVAIMSGSELRDVFETALSLQAPTVDDSGDIYVATLGSCDDRSTLYKMRPDGNLSWSFELSGHAETLPVVYRGCVFISDFTADPRDGYLYRLTEGGKLLWRKHFKGIIWGDPLILDDDNMVLGFRFLNQMTMMDLDGNIKHQRTESRAGTIPFSQGQSGELYACFNGNLVALDRTLKDIWTYRPERGFADLAPVVSPSGNLYLPVVGGYCRLVSLDPRGTVRWATDTQGFDGPRPVLLENGEILIATSRNSEKEAGEEEHITFIEVFDDTGKKSLEYELPGSIVDVSQSTDGTIFATVNRFRRIRKKGRHDLIADRAIRVYSFTLS